MNFCRFGARFLASSPTFERFASQCKTFQPSWLVVLGSGLGSLFVSDPNSPEICFAELPGVPASTVSGHVGKWVLTRLGNHAVILSLGRLHYYEGHAWETVTRPVSLAAELGVKAVLLTNAAGGIRDDLQPGTIMPIRDHLEWNLPEPWRTPANPCPYTPRLLSLLLEFASEIGMDLLPGVYASVRGPSYETPAEIRALRQAGADAVGMSTSREAAAARTSGLACLGLSVITNRAAGLTDNKLSHQEVMEQGMAAANDLRLLLHAFFQRVPGVTFEDVTGR